MHTVFVYGTLRTTECNHWMMQRAEGQFYKDDAIQARRVTVAGSLPGVILDEKHTVTGELFHVNELGLAGLDRFEGHPHLYKRTEVETVGGVKAWVYIPDSFYVNGETKTEQG